MSRASQRQANKWLAALRATPAEILPHVLDAVEDIGHQGEPTATLPHLDWTSAADPDRSTLRLLAVFAGQDRRQLAEVLDHLHEMVEAHIPEGQRLHGAGSTRLPFSRYPASAFKSLIDADFMFPERAS